MTTVTLPLASRSTRTLSVGPKPRIFHEETEPGADGFTSRTPALDRVAQPCPAEPIKGIFQKTGVIPRLQYHIDQAHLADACGASWHRPVKLRHLTWNGVNSDTTSDGIEQTLADKGSFLLVSARDSCRRRLVREANMSGYR